MEFTEELKDLIRYGDIVSDNHFITDDGSHRILIIKKTVLAFKEFHILHMHNGDIVQHIKLE